MITHERFIARSSDRDLWLAARSEAVTATMVADVLSPKSFDRVAAAMGTVEDIPDNPYMKFGRDNEGWIALELKSQFGIMPNEWLIAADEHRWHCATPDGLSLDHNTISEIKTTGKDWETLKDVPRRYHRQVQWQLHVTGAQLCQFAFVLRAQAPNGDMFPAWFQPRVFEIQRDEKLIEELIETASQLRMHSVYKSWSEETPQTTEER